MYFHRLSALAIVGLVSLSACDNLSRNQNTAVGALGGAAVGLITANALNANSNWRIVATLAGAAAGTLVARNATTRRCAYAHGDGTYYTAPCR